MNKKALIIIPAMIAVVIGVAIAMRSGSDETRIARTEPSVLTPPVQRQPVQPHQQMTTDGRVPAHFETPPPKESLRATLAPEQFTGPTREAYRAVREIPQTIAQLPCYCHCDEGFGHKSLHSCFEDDHGSHCAVCVNEALMAYQMEKQMGLSPAEIRQRINAQYGITAAAPSSNNPDKKMDKMSH